MKTLQELESFQNLEEKILDAILVYAKRTPEFLTLLSDSKSDIKPTERYRKYLERRGSEGPLEEGLSLLDSFSDVKRSLTTVLDIFSDFIIKLHTGGLTSLDSSEEKIISAEAREIYAAAIELTYRNASSINFFSNPDITQPRNHLIHILILFPQILADLRSEFIHRFLSLGFGKLNSGVITRIENVTPSPTTFGPAEFKLANLSFSLGYLSVMMNDSQMVYRLEYSSENFIHERFSHIKSMSTETTTLPAALMIPRNETLICFTTPSAKSFIDFFECKTVKSAHIQKLDELLQNYSAINQRYNSLKIPPTPSKEILEFYQNSLEFHRNHVHAVFLTLLKPDLEGVDELFNEYTLFTMKKILDSFLLDKDIFLQLTPEYWPWSIKINGPYGYDIIKKIMPIIHKEMMPTIIECRKIISIFDSEKNREWANKFHLEILQFFFNQIKYFINEALQKFYFLASNSFEIAIPELFKKLNEEFLITTNQYYRFLRDEIIGAHHEHPFVKSLFQYLDNNYREELNQKTLNPVLIEITTTAAKNKNFKEGQQLDFVQKILDSKNIDWNKKITLTHELEVSFPEGLALLWCALHDAKFLKDKVKPAHKDLKEEELQTFLEEQFLSCLFEEELQHLGPIQGLRKIAELFSVYIEGPQISDKPKKILDDETPPLESKGAQVDNPPEKKINIDEKLPLDSKRTKIDFRPKWEHSDSQDELATSGLFSFSTQKPKDVFEEDKSDLLIGIEASLKEDKDQAAIAASLIRYSNSHGFRTSNVPNDGLCFYYAVIDQLNVRMDLGLTGLGLPHSGSQATPTLRLIAKNLRKLVSEHIIKNFNLYSTRIPLYVKGGMQLGESDEKMAIRLASDLLATDPIPFADEFEMEILAKVLNIKIFSLLNTGVTGCINSHKDTVVNIFIGNEQMRHFQSLKNAQGDFAAEARKNLISSFEELDKEDITQYAPGTVAIPIKELLISPSSSEIKESKYEMLPKMSSLIKLSLGDPVVPASITSLPSSSSHKDKAYFQAYKRETIALAEETGIGLFINKFVQLVLQTQTLHALVGVTKEFAEVLSYQNSDLLLHIARSLQLIIINMNNTIREIKEQPSLDVNDDEGAETKESASAQQFPHFNFVPHHDEEDDEEEDDEDDEDESETSAHRQRSNHFGS